jgi:opacity protein-like surface antigen
MLRFKMICPSVLAASVSAIALPALAGTPYIGVGAGVTLPNKSKDRGALTGTVPATAAFPAIASGTSLGLETRFKKGFNVSGFAGYRFDNGFRLEAEVAYSENRVKDHRNLAVGGTVIDGLDSAVLTRGAASATNPLVGTVIGNGGGGRVSNWAVMGNAYYDFNSGGSIQPYIGGGLGIQKVDVRYSPSNVGVSRGDKAVFAYQGMAGLTYKVSPSFEVFGEYKYRGADRASVPLQLLPATWGVQSGQSILSMGVRIPLGGGGSE